MPEFVICLLCHKVVCEGEQCSACDAPFCGSCVLIHSNSSVKCPECKETYKMNRLNKATLAYLQPMQFKCHSDGEVYEYGQAIKHAKSHHAIFCRLGCPEASKHSMKCESDYEEHLVN